MPKCLFPATALVLMATAAPAQTVLNGNHSVDGNLCVGAACTNAETFSDAQLKLKGGIPRLLFEDNSSSGGVPTNDWVIETNADSATEYFAIVDDETDRSVLRIDAGGPENSLFVAANGDIGLGTSTPQAPLHIITETASGLRMERSYNTGPVSYDLYLKNSGDFGIYSTGGNTTPFRLSTFAKDDALVLLPTRTVLNGGSLNIDTVISGNGNFDAFVLDADTSNVGLNILTPSAALHLQRNNNTARLLVEDTGASGAQEMFKLSNNGGSYFTFDNTAAGTT